MAKTDYKLSQAQIEAIERVVNRGDRAEVIRTRDGLRIVRTQTVLIDNDKPRQP